MPFAGVIEKQTRWPWYGSIAPVSWLVRDPVDEGRALLDLTPDELAALAAGLEATVHQ